MSKNKKNDIKTVQAKPKVKDVRIVDDTTKPKVGKRHILLIIGLFVAIYVFLNAKVLYLAYEKGNLSTVFLETSKEIIYSTGFTFLFYFVINYCINT